MSWPLPLGQATPVMAESEAWNWRRVIFVVLASLAAGALVVVLGVRLLGRLRDWRQRPGGAVSPEGPPSVVSGP